MKPYVSLGICLLLGVVGCSSPPAPSNIPAANHEQVSAEQLQTVVPHLPPEFPSVLFLKRPGLVTYHVRRDGTLVATLSVNDLVQREPALREMFRGSKMRVQDYPAIETSMGGGIAVLVADRFRVEVVSLGPAVGEKRRDAWLNAFDFARLVAMGNITQ